MEWSTSKRIQNAHGKAWHPAVSAGLGEFDGFDPECWQREFGNSRVVGVASASTPTTEARVISIVVRFKPTNLTTGQYEESIRRIKEAGEFPPDGCDYHIFFGSEGDLQVSKVWD